jgi:hypothetical protein
MKDEIFEKKLESILETLYKVDLEVNEYFTKLKTKKQNHNDYHPTNINKAYQHNCNTQL